MQAQLRPGMAVKQIVPVIEGVITKIRWKDEDKCFEVLVEWQGEDGVVSRWFNETEVVDATPSKEEGESNE
jgi:hypothetical protein